MSHVVLAVDWFKPNPAWFTEHNVKSSDMVVSISVRLVLLRVDPSLDLPRFLLSDLLVKIR